MGNGAAPPTSNVLLLRHQRLQSPEPCPSSDLCAPQLKDGGIYPLRRSCQGSDTSCIIVDENAHRNPLQNNRHSGRSKKDCIHHTTRIHHCVVEFSFDTEIHATRSAASSAQCGLVSSQMICSDSSYHGPRHALKHTLNPGRPNHSIQCTLQLVIESDYHSTVCCHTKRALKIHKTSRHRAMLKRNFSMGPV